MKEFIGDGMKKKMALGISVISFYLMQYPVGQYDFDDTRRFVIMVFGTVGVAMFINSRFDIIRANVLILTVLIVAGSAINWVQGYSLIWLTLSISLVGIAYLFSMINSFNACLLLASVIPIQIHARYFDDQVFVVGFNNFGTVGGVIIYSTLMYAGLMSSLKLFFDDNRLAVKVIAAIISLAGLREIIAAEERAVLIITVISLAVIIYGKTGIVAAVAATLSLSAIVYFASSRDLLCLANRPDIWHDAIKDMMKNPMSAVYGNGIWSFPLNSGGGHPHNEIINLVYDFGIPVTVYFLAIFAFVGKYSGDVFTACLYYGTSLSFITNSGRYPVLAFVVALVAGQCIRNYRKICDESRCVNLLW